MRFSPHRIRRYRSLRAEWLETRHLLSADLASAMLVTDGIAPQMVDGTAAPYFAAVGAIQDSSHFSYCSGTLIDRQHVLTAGHCFDTNGDGVSDAKYFVTSQDSDIRKNGVTYKVIDAIRHPNYYIKLDNSTKPPNLIAIKNDIAILRLETLVKDVVPIPISRSAPERGDVPLLLGFGLIGTKNGKLTSNGVIRNKGYVEIDSVGPTTYSWAYDQTGESNTAPGDSGGPGLLSFDGKTNQIVGVHSYGDTAATTPGAHSTDERVDVHAAWIDSVVATVYAQGPTATVAWSDDVTDPKSLTYNLRVTYTDINGVAETNLSQPHISLSGPNSYFSVTPDIGLVIRSADRTQLTVDYRFRGPGGIWTANENGRYVVSLLNNGIRDSLGNPVGARQIASFSVAVPRDTSPPTALFTPTNYHNTNAIVSGTPYYNFYVRYADDSGVDASTMGSDDIYVVRDNSTTTIPAQLITSPGIRDWPIIDAIYQITPPGGSWDAADNGTYHVILRSGSIWDVNRNRIAGGDLGTFTVNLTPNAPANPYAILSAPDITTTSNNRKHTFNVTFTGSAAINASSIQNSTTNILVEPTAGTTADNASLVSFTTSANGAITATYQFDSFTTWSEADNGISFKVTLTGTITDVNGRAVPRGLLGSYRIANTAASQDRIAPQAQLQTNDVRLPGSRAQLLSVAFSDDIAINATTLTDDSLFVVAPNNALVPIALSGVNYANDASVVAATLAVSAPGGSWDENDDGLYRVYLRDGAISDLNGNTITSGNQTLGNGVQLGAFSVDISRTIDTSPTKAELRVAPLVATNQSDYRFTIVYTSPNGIDLSKFSANDIYVTGRDGAYEQYAQLISSATSDNGRTVTVTYRLTPPGGQWLQSDNGQYDVYVSGVAPLAATDNSGFSVLPGLLGSFQVAIGIPLVLLSNTTVTENSPEAAIGQVTTSSASGPFVYSVSDSRFEVVNDVLRLKAGQALNFEAAPQVQLTITSTFGAPSQSAVGVFLISVGDVNESPTNILLTSNLVSENTPGATVASLIAIDPDQGDTFTFSVDDGRFEVVGGQLRLKANIPLDYEQQAMVPLSITVTDNGTPNLSFTKQFSLVVADVNEPPTFTSAPQVSVSELRTAVVKLSASDPDRPAQTLSYVITGGADSALFWIDANHVLRFVQAPLFYVPLDANRNNTYEVQLTVLDGAGQQSSVLELVTVIPLAPPTNDNFANAIELSGISTSTDSANIGATVETGEPNPWQLMSSHSVWWTWTSPGTGNVVVTTTSASSNAYFVIGAYVGSSLETLVPVSASSSMSSMYSSMGFNALAGVTYSILVDVADSSIAPTALPSEFTLSLLANVTSAPVIRLQGNGSPIANQDMQPGVSDGTDLGTTHVGDEGATRTFTILNKGTADLHLLDNPSVMYSGLSSREFQIVSQPASTIPAGGSTTFQVRFTPLALGMRYGVVSIPTDDSSTGAFSFAIQGYGSPWQGRRIQVSNSGVAIANQDNTPDVNDGTDFGDRERGTISYRTFTITNVGTEPIKLTGNSPISLTLAPNTEPGTFKVTKSPAKTILAGQSTTFTLQFKASAVGEKSAKLVIASNDANQSERYEFNIRGGAIQTVDNRTAKLSGRWYNELSTGRGRFAYPNSNSNATYSFNVTPGTPISVLATWPALSYASSNTSVSVFDGKTFFGVVNLNQRNAPNGALLPYWQLLTQFVPTSKTLKLVLSTKDADGVILADRFQVIPAQANTAQALPRLAAAPVLGVAPSADRQATLGPASSPATLSTTSPSLHANTLVANISASTTVNRDSRQGKTPVEFIDVCPALDAANVDYLWNLEDLG